MAILCLPIFTKIPRQRAIFGGPFGGPSGLKKRGAPKMPLTDVKIRALKPKDKPYKVADEKGLFLLVKPNGGKYWRLKYRFNNKEKKLSFGVYPDISLADARVKCDEARRLVANESDPGIFKQMTKDAKKTAIQNSFERVAREWLATHLHKWKSNYGAKVLRILEIHIFPWIGHKPITEITSPDLLTVLRRIEEKGRYETAHRAKQNCSLIFLYAIATGVATYDPAHNLRHALKPVVVRHHPSPKDPKEISVLMRSIKTYNGHIPVRYALLLSAYLFGRPGEIRHAEWSEFDLDNLQEWRIPAEKMKMGVMHLVPLATQAIHIIRELHPYTNYSKYLFPSVVSASEPMSDNTINMALHRMGYGRDQMTAHGFRSMASTLLNEQGWNRDAIERQLAHSERNSVRAAYNYAEYLPERRKMMQHWADYLDSLAETNQTLNKLPLELVG